MCTNICGVNDTQDKRRLFTGDLASMIVKGRFGALRRHLYEYVHSRRHDIYKRVTLPSFGSEGTNISEKEISQYLDEIAKYNPYLMEGLPLYLYAFAKYLLRKELSPPKVGVIKPFGGSLTGVMKERIGRAFDCEVYDTYGCSELGFIACDCEAHEGLHIFMDLYLVEVVRNGKVADPGELGRLYITDLTNVAMPWIRYDIGDVGRYLPGDHACGRHSRRIQVEGRVQDTLVNSRGELFTSDVVFDFFHGQGNIDNFQLVEKSAGRFDLLCVPVNGAGIDKNKVGCEFKQFFDSESLVKVYEVKSIKAEDGGKFRFVKSKTYESV